MKNFVVLCLLIAFWWVAIILWVAKFMLPEGDMLDLVKTMLAHIKEAIRFGGIFVGWLMVLIGVISIFIPGSIGANIGIVLLGGILIWVSKLIEKAPSAAETEYQRELRKAEDVLANPLSHSKEKVEESKLKLNEYHERYEELKAREDGNEFIN